MAPSSSDDIPLGVPGAPFQVHVSSANLQPNEKLNLTGRDNNERLTK